MAVHTPHQRLRSSAFWGSGGENNLGEKTVKRDIKHQTIQKCHCSPETNVQISLETCVCECCLMHVCATWERSGETSHPVSSHFYWCWELFIDFKGENGLQCEWSVWLKCGVCRMDGEVWVNGFCWWHMSSVRELSRTTATHGAESSGCTSPLFAVVAVGPLSVEERGSESSRQGRGVGSVMVKRKQPDE